MVQLRHFEGNAAMLRRLARSKIIVRAHYQSDKIRSRMLFLRSVPHMTVIIALFLFSLVYCFSGLAPFPWIRFSACANDGSSRNLEKEGGILDGFTHTAIRRLRSPHWTNLLTLVVVPGHAIFVGNKWDEKSIREERNWVLEPFQKGQVSTFLKHIRKGVELAANDSSALLLFSGGQTRERAGPRSEGLTYWMIADSARWFGYGSKGVKNRSLAEEYARDSMENVLFSICRFRQVVGRYPMAIKIVGFGFKKARFVNMHRRSLRFPVHRFEYHGVDPVGFETDPRSAGERANALELFSRDPYGCNMVGLTRKKEQRNPNLRYHPYPQGCPEIAELFRYCGPSIFTGPLPWGTLHI